MARTIQQLIDGLRKLGSGVAVEAANLIEKSEEIMNKEPIRVRHVKRQSEYTVAPMTFELQSSAGPVPEGTKLVMYVTVDSTIKGYARPVNEFNDGRFEKVKGDAPTE